MDGLFDEAIVIRRWRDVLTTDGKQRQLEWSINTEVSIQPASKDMVYDIFGIDSKRRVREVIGFFLDNSREGDEVEMRDGSIWRVAKVNHWRRWGHSEMIIYGIEEDV